MEALSRRYPQTTFTVAYGDEDIGYNAGRYITRNGEYLETDDIYNDTCEAYEIAFSLWGCADEYRFNDLTGSYEYIDDDFVEDQEAV